MSEAECPYCGCVPGDIWEWRMNEMDCEGEIECDDCGKTYKLRRVTSVDYYSDKLEGAE